MQAPIDQTITKLNETLEAIASGLDIVFVPFSLEQIERDEQKVFSEMLDNCVELQGMARTRADQIDVRYGRFLLRVEVIRPAKRVR